jgi:hypothetical protein
MVASSYAHELLEQNEFFDMIVDMIPSKIYIAGKSGDDYNPKSKYHKNASNEKETRRAEAKAAKRRKLDPSQAETTVQKKNRLDETIDVAPPVSVKKQPVVKEVKETTATSPHASRIEALREKLHAKIASKQGQRPPPDQVSKRAARRAEKKKRQDAAKKAKTGASTKVKDSDKTHYKVADATAVVDAGQDLATVDYGRLAGLNASSTGNYLDTNKSLANLSKPKNFKKILADAEAKREKLEALKQGSEKDKEKANAMQWKDVMQEADGKRVKDDPSKLKKVIKRKAAKKAKSQKAWKTRVEQTVAKKDDRQKIRTHNLNARKEGGQAAANLSSKRIAPEKEDEGRRMSRAGFEGKKKDFLNSGKQ